MEFDSDDCLRQVMAINGVLCASLVDCRSGQSINSAGREPAENRQVTAAGVTSIVSAALDGAPFASIGIVDRLDTIVVTAGNGYHLIRFVASPPEALLALYVWLDRILGNLAMAERHIRLVADGLVAAR
jgi:hypothetical protein